MRLALYSKVKVNEVVLDNGVWIKRVSHTGYINKIIKHDGYLEYVVNGVKYRHHQLERILT